MRTRRAVATSPGAATSCAGWMSGAPAGPAAWPWTRTRPTRPATGMTPWRGWGAGEGWCTGKVGGGAIPYGGFTAIQVAVPRPPHLRAIVPVYATDDRY